MSLELVNTFATLGTFVVIAATAIAAIMQLRHMRSGNQIAAFNELRETTQKPDFQDAQQFVQTQLESNLQDPALRHQLEHPRARTEEVAPVIALATTVGNFYEGMGALVRTGLVDKDLVLDIYSDRVIGAWENLAPVTSIVRRRVGDALWENFEYLTVLSEDFIAAYPKGTYPAGVRRIGLKDEWLEADKQYSASLAPA
jgi:hypothetical protein